MDLKVVASSSISLFNVFSGTIGNNLYDLRRVELMWFRNSRDFYIPTTISRVKMKIEEIVCTIIITAYKWTLI